MESVLASLETSVDRHPDKLLYSFLDVNGNPIASHSYGSFLNRVDLIASHLIARRNFQAGDRVLLAYPPGLEMICSMFACVRAGLIPVPAPPPTAYGLTSALYQMAHISLDCQPAAILTSHDCYALVTRNRRQVNGDTVGADIFASSSVESIVTDELMESAGPSPNGRGGEIFFLQYTSGSTSRPRGVVVTHQNLVHNCRLVVDHETPIAVSWLPQHHDMGLIGYYIYILLSGGTTYGFSPASFIQRPLLWLETISRHSATGSSAPNFAFEYCLRSRRLPEATLGKLDLSSLRFLMAAAEPVSPDTYRRFLQKFEQHGLKPESFFVAYGLAENTLAVTNYGRRAISVNRKRLQQGVASITRGVSEVGVATHVMSCGKPLGDNTVRIVQPDSRVKLPDGEVGEVWVDGHSKCGGYWNNPELTSEVFRGRIEGAADDTSEYLRTGDMGFLHDGELYVCGRRKDMIIVRGQNFFPKDIGAIVERASPLVRKGSVAAFEIEMNQEVVAAVIAEVVSPKEAPDARAIAAAIREYLGLDVGLIAFVQPRSVPKTSSGKIIHYRAKQMWLAGELPAISRFVSHTAGEASADAHDDLSPFGFLRARYRLTGQEPHSLIDAGVNSLDLVIFVHDLKELLEARGANLVASQVDFWLVQRMSIADLFALVDHLEEAPDAAVQQLSAIIASMREEHLADERATMTRDCALTFSPSATAFPGVPQAHQVVLLTGGTGFLGPFLLKSLLEQTDAEIRVLVRDRSPDMARERLRAAVEASAGAHSSLIAQFERRVVTICGDLEKPDLALGPEGWNKLASEVDTIYHNGAFVNYLFSYASMRSANVGGTDEVLRLAFDGRAKQFNHVSTTFIFGWATKAVLYEADSNAEMDLLDFGYSQSKWVAERKVAAAARNGLRTRIFRPSLITPSVGGGGSSFDIAIRLLAFMVKHGIGVNAGNQVSFVPVDVTANNIVAIANQADSLGRTFHVTRDEYSSMMDVTDIIQARTGRRFQMFGIDEFVPEVIKRCTRDDLLFPLLDFLIGSVDNISSMEFKRYDSSGYQSARNASRWGVADPSLDDTVGGILEFMTRMRLL